MIERFEEGKSYRWVGGKTRPFDWNSGGNMDFLMDGEPHKVIKINHGPLPNLITFEDDGEEWCLAFDERNFEEVKNNA